MKENQHRKQYVIYIDLYLNTGKFLNLTKLIQEEIINPNNHRYTFMCMYMYTHTYICIYTYIGNVH